MRVVELRRAALSTRRHALQWLALAAAPAVPTVLAADAADAAEVAKGLLREGGGLVVAMCHALAPGTFDPPGFRPGVCATQRNLDDAGREQARRIGAWYRANGLLPTAVRASEWCRCLDTARLAFGTVEPWPALNSVIGERESEPAKTAVLRTALLRLAQTRASGFEVWVTHQANISALAGSATDSGEALLLRHDSASGRPRVLATF